MKTTIQRRPLNSVFLTSCIGLFIVLVAIVSSVSKHVQAGVAGTPSAIGAIAVNGVPTTRLYEGDPTITGTNFSTANDNTIHLVSAKDSTQIYDINAGPSSDGKTLSFLMPTGASAVPLGTYTLQVGAFNSPWSSPTTVTVVAPPVSFSTTEVTATTTSFAWSSTLAVPGSSYSCPAGTAGTSYVVGQNGQSFKFDGTTGYASIPTGTLPSGNSPITVSTWVNWAGNGTNVQNIIMAYGNDGSTGGTAVILSVDATGLPHFEFGAGKGGVSGTSVLAKNTWYQITGVYDGSASAIYVNGQPSKSVAYSSAAIQRTRNTDSANVGAVGGFFSSYGNVGSGTVKRYGTFNGSIDDLRIYSSALSASAISALYSSDNNCTPPSTVGITYTLVETSPATTTLLANSALTSFQATGLAPDTKYCYTLTANNGAGSANSSLCTMTPSDTSVKGADIATSTLAFSLTAPYSILTSGTNQIGQTQSTSTIIASFPLAITAGNSDIYLGTSASTTPAYLFNVLDSSGTVVYSGNGVSSVINTAHLTNVKVILPTLPNSVLLATSSPNTYRISAGTSVNLGTVQFQFAGKDSNGNPLSGNPYTVRLVSASYVAKGIQGTSNFAGGLAFVPPASPPPTLSIGSVSSRAMAFSWSDTDPTLLSYVLVQNTPSHVVLASGSNGFIQYGISNLLPSTTYCFAVIATNASGATTTSSQNCATTANNANNPSYTSPNDPSITLNSTSATSSIVFSWTYANATTSTLYTLTEKSPVTATLISGSVQTSYTLGNLVPGTTYCVTLSVANGSSTPVTSTACPSTLPIPRNIVALGIDSSHINLTWTAQVENCSGQDNFHTLIERSAFGANTFAQVGKTGPGVANFGDSGLIASTSYDYRLHTDCEFRDSFQTYVGEYSAIVTGSTTNGQVSGPTAPTLVADGVTDQHYPSWDGLFTWTDADSSVVSYTLFETSPLTQALLTNTNQTSYQMTDTNAESLYCAVVVAANGSGQTATSTTACGTTPSLAFNYHNSFMASIGNIWHVIVGWFGFR